MEQTEDLVEEVEMVAARMVVQVVEGTVAVMEASTVVVD